jgi:putative tricarboxylic transport membrane protein
VAYYFEKKISKHPEKFGTGLIEGLAAPEAANNSVCASTMTHTLVLGIPGGATTAVMLGALMLHGIRPGPTIFAEHHDIIWGLICGMYVGNFMSLIIGITCNGLMLRVLGCLMPPWLLAFAFCNYIYAMDNSTDDLAYLISGAGYVMTS